MTVTWTIKKMYRSPVYGDNTNVIRTISYMAKCDKTVDGKLATSNKRGEVVLDVSDLSTFTAYDNVTESQALQWVYDALGDKKAQIETELEMQTEYSLNPSQVNGLPWD